MTSKTHKSRLGRLQSLLARLKGKKQRDFARNTAILNDTPKNHKPGKSKIVQK